MADWNGFKKNGTSYIPNDATARGWIGTLANLTTTVKTSIVNAINELVTAIGGKLSIADNAVLGAKNIMPISVKSTTLSGVDLTVNEDKSIRMLGTATENISFIFDNQYILKKGNYKKTFIFEGTASNTVYFTDTLCNADGTTKTNDYISIGLSQPNQAEQDFVIEGTDFVKQFRLFIPSGRTVDCTVKCMISLSGGEYAPPAMTNLELTNKIHQLVHRVVYKSTDEGRSDLTIGAEGNADISIPSLTGYRILSTNVTITGAGSSQYSYVSGAGGTNTRKIVNRGSQSYTWGYEVEVYYIATDEID